MAIKMIRRGTNTQTLLPDNLYLADIDGDGVYEYVQFACNKIFVCRNDYEKDGLLHVYLKRPIKRLIIGHFSGERHAIVCAILDTHELAAYGANPDRDILWWWFTQGSFIGDNEDAIVGDFNDDGKDDILVYNRGSGELRMYSPKSQWFFELMPNFDIGNMSRVAVPGMRFCAGHFNGSKRVDIVAIHPNGQIGLFCSVYTEGRTTFWWSFTSNSGIVHPNEEACAARIENGLGDALVLHNRVTGSTRFLDVKYNGGNPPTITAVRTGQIDSSPDSSLCFATLTRDYGKREDVVVFLHSTRMFARADARWDDSKRIMTYWWRHTHHAPKNHTGWAPFESKPWLLIKCKFADKPEIPQENKFWHDLFTSKGHQSIVYYFHEISYGAIAQEGNTVDDNWYTMNITLEQTRQEHRRTRIQHGLDAAHANLSGFFNVVVVNNVTFDGGFCDHVLVDLNSSNGTFVAHEMLHALGFDHSYDDTSRRTNDWSAPGEYGDEWDIMSAMNVHRFQNVMDIGMGPEMNGPLRMRAGWIPVHRILCRSHSSERVDVKLAALNKPENDGPLLVRFGDNDNDYFTIEFRKKFRYDAGIPHDTVLVHRVLNKRSILVTNGGTERLPGSEHTFENGMMLKVKQFFQYGSALIEV